MMDSAVSAPTAAVDRGKIMAALLEGAWRTQPGSASVSEEQLALVLPVLVRSGTAALAWRRIRNTPVASTDTGRRVQTARRIQAAEAAIRLAQLEQVVALEGLKEADPILLKGWAHSGLYPEPALRHYTDIDLLVHPAKVGLAYRAATTMVLPDPKRAVPLDIQTSLKDLPDRSWEDLFAHSRFLSLRTGQIRALGYEDMLRLSCIHLLRHLGFQPLWLCDVSALIETLPGNFNWEYCLSGDPRRTQWMLAVIRLANQVFGTNVGGCPPRRLPRAVPPWMMRAMLRWWGTETTYIYPWPLPNHVVSVARDDPRHVLQAFADRWPDPLQAVGRFSWPINRVSGLTAQVLDFTGRALIWAPRQLGFYRRKPSTD
jgi:putative nucleotidyltransferase-like protein